VVRARAAESWLAGTGAIADIASLPATLAKEFGQRASKECTPISDHRSTADYRRHAVAVLAERLLMRAAAHADGGLQRDSRNGSSR